jgi:hypothetical protein
MKKPPVRIAPILALFLPLFSLFPAPAGAATELSGLPTATAVVINSPSTTTGHGNTGYGVYRVITGPASATPASSPASPATAPPSDSLRLNLNATPPTACTAPIYGTIAARSPDGALCLCRRSYDGKQSIWEQIGTGQSCWPDKK